MCVHKVDMACILLGGLYFVTVKYCDLLVEAGFGIIEIF